MPESRHLLIRCALIAGVCLFAWQRGADSAPTNVPAAATPAAPVKAPAAMSPPAAAPAAATPAPTPAPPESRDEMVKRMEEQVKALRDQNVAAREAGKSVEAAAKAAAGQKAQADKKGGGQAAQLRNLSEKAVMYFDPPDIAVAEGALASTDIVIRCQKQRAFQTIDIVLQYDPLVLEPVNVHDNLLRPLLEGKPVFAVDPIRGRLSYSATLKEPMTFFSQRLLTVIWKAKRSANFSEVSFEWRDTPAKRSSIRQGMADLLTDPLVPRGGLVPLGVSVLPANASVNRGFIPPGEAAPLGVPSFHQGEVWYDLEGPILEVEPGKEFDVKIVLQNPGKTQFDTISLWLKYPKEKIEVLDWDMGNWIRRGINIHDAPFGAHENFPFNFHIANQVFPETGDILFRMGVTSAPAKTQGVVAEIKARALAPVTVYDFEFVMEAIGNAPVTDVSFLGASVLSGRSAEADALPVLERVVVETGASDAEAGVSAPRESR